MQSNHILIRYGEISLKGKNRKVFINQLHENVKRALKEYRDIKVKQTHDRMFVLLNGTDPQDIIEKCKYIFGIQSISLAMKVENEVEEIKAGALEALNQAENAKTFKITTKRSNKTFPIGSQDMNQVLGGHLLSNTTNYKVDVHQPDIELTVEIRTDATYITSKRVQGMGGLPVGSSGKTLLLLSGGIDSPVAGYLTMKRGVRIEAIHFHSPPYTSERAKQKVLDLAKKLTGYGHSIRVHIVPFTMLQQIIHREVPHGYSMTVMRRMMLRISQMVAEKEGILSLTTGESLGQVASQTMESMNAINEVTNYPVLRPLVAMDKDDIISLSKHIQTYDISIRPYEDCCTVFVPNAPKTKPKKAKVIQLEKFLDVEQELQKTIENIETVEITSHSNQNNHFEELL
ncbi:tRNA 4-thiouridine(8) synthase ThiI [Aquibacillus sp. 3ASR75-11]|uniref:Probable tRNA sulfurtransferase n=1 Tax=Terrihalobacillus insolitus TaxID=2950438 RepID=A0A9X4AL92_9BACI|nr:tRNA uracil 4-sulfurtransferase ThiI [Terrihalobacillus insolitus]MDC3412666.1 tRNA 4-thiouridine(8) synthase ThiI [Terrihalobacillus insolitus]MDC3424016.1 tRNA 4-thiouridine(8) synthase ThiI [Terrihalobacillus insolitus]